MAVQAGATQGAAVLGFAADRQLGIDILARPGGNGSASEIVFGTENHRNRGDTILYIYIYHITMSYVIHSGYRSDFSRIYGR